MTIFGRTIKDGDRYSVDVLRRMFLSGIDNTEEQLKRQREEKCQLFSAMPCTNRFCSMIQCPVDGRFAFNFTLVSFSGHRPRLHSWIPVGTLYYGFNDKANSKCYCKLKIKRITGPKRQVAFSIPEMQKDCIDELDSRWSSWWECGVKSSMLR